MPTLTLAFFYALWDENSTLLQGFFLCLQPFLYCIRKRRIDAEKNERKNLEHIENKGLKALDLCSE